MLQKRKNKIKSTHLPTYLFLIYLPIYLCISPSTHTYIHTYREEAGKREKEEGHVLFNDALNTFYLRLYGVKLRVKTTKIAREETHCHHMGYSFRLAARVLLYAPSHREDNTYHGLCYTRCIMNGHYHGATSCSAITGMPASRGALAGMINSSMGPP